MGLAKDQLPWLANTGMSATYAAAKSASAAARGAGNPRSNPSTLRSSSMSGQWMPYPPPVTFQLFRSWSVACRSRGYQANGTMIERPSSRSTRKVSLVQRTVLTLVSTLIAFAAQLSAPPAQSRPSRRLERQWAREARSQSTQPVLAQVLRPALAAWARRQVGPWVGAKAAPGVLQSVNPAPAAGRGLRRRPSDSSR